MDRCSWCCCVRCEDGRVSSTSSNEKYSSQKHPRSPESFSQGLQRPRQPKGSFATVLTVAASALQKKEASRQTCQLSKEKLSISPTMEHFISCAQLQEGDAVVAISDHGSRACICQGGGRPAAQICQAFVNPATLRGRARPRGLVGR